MEQEIVQRCKAGDLAAFEKLFHLYGKKLYSLCMRMSGNSHEAEDLMQEIFVILIKKIKAFRGDSKFSTWLYRVAVNTCISQLRKKKKNLVPLAEEDEPAKILSVQPSPVAQRETLKKAIASLPPGYRTAIVMHDIQGFNHAEIAETLGISVGASKSQLFKARRKMRETMAEWENQTVGVNHA